MLSIMEEESTDNAPEGVMVMFGVAVLENILTGET
jgi:hypothetical protein